MRLYTYFEAGVPLSALSLNAGAGLFAFVDGATELPNNGFYWKSYTESGESAVLLLEITATTAMLNSAKEAGFDITELCVNSRHGSEFITKLMSIPDADTLARLCESRQPFTEPAVGEAIATFLAFLWENNIKVLTDDRGRPVNKQGATLQEIGRRTADMLSYRGAYIPLDGDAIISWHTDKEINSPKKYDTPSLLCDNLLFGISGAPNELNGQYLYFTGSSELNNTKSKVQTAKNRDVVDVNPNTFLYFTGSYDKLRFFGRPCAHDRYNVVILKERYEYIERIKQIQADYVNQLYSLPQMVVYRLPECHTAITQNHMAQFDGQYLGVGKKGDLFTLTRNKKELSHVMHPPKLAFKIRDIFERNAHRLINVMDGTATGKGFVRTDITDALYAKDAKGKLKVIDSLKQTTKQLKFQINCPITGKVVTVPMVIGADTPDRNAISKWVKNNPNISVWAWRVTDVEFAYALVIETDEGWLYWNCEYGSKHYLPTARKRK